MEQTDILSGIAAELSASDDERSRAYADAIASVVKNILSKAL